MTDASATHRRKVLLAAYGTRGDVQPYLALGDKLRTAGYRVKVAAPANFAGWVEQHNFEYARLGADIKAWVLKPETIDMLSRTSWSQIVNFRTALQRVFHDSFDDLVKASEGVDAILYGSLLDCATDIAEARKIPAIALPLQPQTVTASFPSVVFPFSTAGSTINALSWRLTELLRFALRREIAMKRTELGLAPSRGHWRPHHIGPTPVPKLYGFSRHLVPRPPDWPSRDRICGFWFLDEAIENVSQPCTQAGLLEFLAKGPPPLYVGFGSIPLPEGPRRIRMLKEVLSQLRQRALIAPGWSGVAENTDSKSDDLFYTVQPVPFSWLFQHVSAVIHHGGAGTLATGLRAARPTLVCPIHTDQTFWGHRVAQAGLGPRPLRVQRWTHDSLARSITDLLGTTSYRVNAAAIADKLLDEQGIETAVALIKRMIGDP